MSEDDDKLKILRVWLRVRGMAYYAEWRNDTIHAPVLVQAMFSPDEKAAAEPFEVVRFHRFELRVNGHFHAWRITGFLNGHSAVVEN